MNLKEKIKAYFKLIDEINKIEYSVSLVCSNSSMRRSMLCDCTKFQDLNNELYKIEKELRVIQ